MSQRIPRNVIKYVIVLAITEYIVKHLGSSHEGAIMIHEGLVATLPQIVTLMSIGPFLGGLFVYFGGILADKYGRRLVWAASLFLFGGSMFLIAYATTYRMALVASIPWGVSAAFAWASLAWLFDHEGKEGLKTGYGLIYIASVLLMAAGMGVTMMGGFSHRIQIVLTGIVAFAAGGWVVTFPENYGNRSSSWLEIAKSGVRQVISRRALQLIILYSIMIVPVSWSAQMSLFYFEEKFLTSSEEIVQTYKIVDFIPEVAALFAGIFIVLSGKPDYKKLVIYPAVFMGGCYILLPLAPAAFLFYILEGGASLFSLITGVGILILVNDSILENRATTLSLVMLLRMFSVVSRYLWSLQFNSQEWEILFLISGVLGIVAVLVLIWAVKVHERSEPHSVQ